MAKNAVSGSAGSASEEHAQLRLELEQVYSFW